MKRPNGSACCCKPAGVAAETLCGLVSSDSRSELDASDIRPLQRHFHGLQLGASLPASDSGLVVVSQDAATLAHLQRNLGRTEQEYLIEVADGGRARPVVAGAAAAGIRWREGELAERTAPAFRRQGADRQGLRVAVTAAGLQVTAVRRLRIGRVALGPLPPGSGATWAATSGSEVCGSEPLPQARALTLSILQAFLHAWRSSTIGA